MAELLGDEYPAFRAQMGQSPRRGLRTNTLKLTLQRLLALLELEAESLPWCPEGVLLPSELRLGQHPFHAAGLFYLQEPSAMAAVPLLDPQPGERILDLCAAPGGKASHIAAHLQGQGLLWANEIHAGRARVLANNLARWGARNVIISAERPARLADRLPAFFDRVLVDAPCSGEGLFRRDPEATLSWNPAAVQGCARRQRHILEDAARLVRPGGVLVYATCTFAPEENEASVGHFLTTHPDFALEEGPGWQGAAPGRPEWAPEISEPVRYQLTRAVRLWPHQIPGEGHFLARMRRREGASVTPLPPWRAPTPSTAIQQAYAAFCQETLQSPPVEGSLLHLGDRVYACPTGMPDPSGLRTLRPGWLLGRARRNRFIPSHALALALDSTAAQRRLDLDPKDRAAAAFLRGETLSDPGPAGWLLVTVAGFPLGWGKRVGGVVKNHLPRGLRR